MNTHDHTTRSAQGRRFDSARPGELREQLLGDQTGEPDDPSLAAGPPLEAAVRIADCRFLAGCETFNDPLVCRMAKGDTGHGCAAQTDTYRKKHCKGFACKLLTGILREALAKLDRTGPSAPDRRRPGPNAV